jgi:hypothetical protein
LKFRVEIYRQGVATATLIEEEDLEKMFQPRVQVMLLEAYAQNIEEEMKREKLARGKSSI